MLMHSCVRRIPGDHGEKFRRESSLQGCTTTTVTSRMSERMLTAAKEEEDYDDYNESTKQCLCRLIPLFLTPYGIWRQEERDVSKDSYHIPLLST